MMNEIYIALGSALFGSLVLAVYARLNNGTKERLASLEAKIEFLQQEIEEIKRIINEKCFA